MQEIKEAEKILGWLELKEKGKIEKEDNWGKIIKRERKEIYCPKKENRFNIEEGKLLKEIIERFQEGEYKEIQEFVEQYCKRERIILKKEQKERLERILENQLYKYGILSSYLENPNLEEISVIGINKPIYIYYRDKGWLETNAYFSNNKTIIEFANRMSRSLGRRLTLQNPSLNAVLENSDRLNASTKPIAFTGTNITIRKFKEQPFTPLELAENKTYSYDFLGFLSLVLETDSSLLVVGNTGSGKTTLLNALLSLVPENERIVIVEETPEIKNIHKHCIKLNTAEEQEIQMKDLITQTLRMRPDRIIVGEIRTNQEVEAFIDTLLAGHGKGSYASFHGQTGKDALKRLENLGVQKQDLEAIDLVIVQRRWTNLKKGKEIRRITEVLEDGKILFEYSFSKDKLIKKRESKRLKEKIQKSNSVSTSGYKKLLKKRISFLKKLEAKKIEDFFIKYNLNKNKTLFLEKKVSKKNKLSKTIKKSEKKYKIKKRKGRKNAVKKKD